MVWGGFGGNERGVPFKQGNGRKQWRGLGHKKVGFQIRKEGRGTQMRVELNESTI